MRILTLLGTRPEIIRLSVLIPKLDRLAERHILVHTGQNFNVHLNDIFFEQLNIRKPDVIIANREKTIGAQLAVMFQKFEQVLQSEKPDRVLVLGDTNSGLCAIVAERMGIPVVHMEAGNRCFDLNVPEEKNRMVIDTVSTYNLPYTENSKLNLLQTGFPKERIICIGNPIYEVIRYYEQQVNASSILAKLQLSSASYLLATIHRAENVDDPATLQNILQGLSQTADHLSLPVIFPLHPRTKSHLVAVIDQEDYPKIRFIEPLGFFDFLSLEQNAQLVLTDSGTMQEECCIFKVPTVTVRRTTERPETVACGSNMLSGVKANRIREVADIMLSLESDWTCPQGYLEKNVTDKVVKFLLGGKRDV